jgi:8-oxo-dGTP pyrophosphatase MutT (NUDIX family)
MKQTKSIGTFLYYLLWPLVWFYAPLRVRVRVIILFEDKVLVVKNWFGPSSWQLPGGGMKLGENTLETAARELHEELSIELTTENAKILNEEVVITKSGGLLFRYQYVFSVLKSKPDLTLSSEISNVAWVDIANANIPSVIRSKIK